MRKILLLSFLLFSSGSALAKLEHKTTYGDWSHFQGAAYESNLPVILGVADVVSDSNIDTVALRCTTEGVNLLFFKVGEREPLGYAAHAVIDNSKPFEMDVWVKGKTHWATIPLSEIERFAAGSSLNVSLNANNQTHIVTLSLDGFSSMYQALLPSCR